MLEFHHFLIYIQLFYCTEKQIFSVNCDKNLKESIPKVQSIKQSESINLLTKDQLKIICDIILAIDHLYNQFIYTGFQNMKKVESMQTGDCSNCIQKDTLLHKYEQLIKLYKKKQIKVSGCSQSRLTNALTSMDSAPLDPRIFRLQSLLENLVKKREIQIFNVYKQRSSKKLALLRLHNIIKNKTTKSCFNCIRQFTKYSQSKQIDETLGDTQQLNIISGSQYKDCDGQTLIPAKHRINLIKQGLLDLKTKIPYQQLSNRKLKQYQIVNKKLEAQVIHLRKCLEQSSRRQEKQNQKKKDSLQALAEDLQEKGEMIIQLQNALKAYERKYQKNCNILQDDPIAMKREVDHLEAIVDKLNGQNYLLRQKIDKLTLVVNGQEKQIEQLQNQNNILNTIKIEFQQRKQIFENESHNLDDIIQRLIKKMKKIKIYEQQLEKKQLSEGDIVQHIESLKSELILFYLANINLSHHQLKSPHLFDEEERQFLMQHKQKYMRLEDEANKFNKSCLLNQYSKIECLQGKGLAKPDNDIDHSIFSVIQKPQQKQLRGAFSERQGVTMKIIELELQKSKLVQKISQLKQRIMHIRVLFKNLLKSLELQENSLKPDTEGVVRVLFDMYEYSEQQRQQMFPKKKKLFGFI